MPGQTIIEQSTYVRTWHQNASHILQSWQWGEFRRLGGKWQAHRAMIAGVQFTCFVRKLPLRGKIAYIPRLDLPNDTAFFNELQLYAKAQALGLVLIDPNWHKGTRVLPAGVGMGYQIQPQHTNQVSLKSKSETDLWMGMKGNYRRNINKSKRSGVRVEVIDYQSEYRDDAVLSFYRLLQEVSANTDFVLVQLEYFRQLWQVLGESDLARIYLAYDQQDSVVGAYLVVFDANGAYELYGGVSKQGRAVEAGYLLKWEAMLDAHKLGKAFYDHWGIAPFQSRDGVVVYDQSHPLAKISEFKAGFGGSVIAFESQIKLIIDPVVNVQYLLLNSAKSILLKFKKL
jgi:lipid II:glycine glycyltransferase (peptidoglycan interpeptide bridge formation enzyme)